MTEIGIMSDENRIEMLVKRRPNKARHVHDCCQVKHVDSTDTIDLNVSR